MTGKFLKELFYPESSNTFWRYVRMIEGLLGEEVVHWFQMKLFILASPQYVQTFSRLTCMYVQGWWAKGRVIYRSGLQGGQFLKKLFYED